jgi:predicted enzyme related to lactoylglutathione lyase
MVGGMPRVTGIGGVFRVDDLGAMLAQLRAAGVEVIDETEDADYGKFGWAVDPEGNRFELWQPPAGA